MGRGETQPKLPPVAALIHWLDLTLRVADFRLNRPGKTGLAPSLIATLGLVLYVVVAGPAAGNPARSAVAAGVAVVLTGLVWALFRAWGRPPPHLAALVECAVVVVTGVAVRCAGAERQADGILYRHLALPVIGTVVVSIAAAAACARFVFDRGRTRRRAAQAALTLKRYLRTTELFRPEERVTAGVWELLRGALLVPVRAPLQLFLVPAALVLVAEAEWLAPLAVAGLAFAWLVLAFGNVHDRLDMVLRVLSPLFAQGAAGLVSVGVIVLALVRFAGVSYVTTFLDSADRTTIFAVIGSAYAILWWFDAWQARLASDRVVRALGSADGTRLDFDLDPGAQLTSVPARGRRLMVHGASRFAVVHDSDDDLPFFHTWTASALVEALARDRLRASPASKRERRTWFRARSAAAEMKKAFASYVLAANAVPLGILVTLGVVMHGLHQHAELSALERARGLPPKVALSTLVERQCAAGRPVIALAASGGGTRAALYADAVLYGLAELDHAGDVVLASGVSGGGAALAYFAADRAALVKDERGAWDRAFQRMSHAYIADVLNGAFEERIGGAWRLGSLLDESFASTWRAPRASMADVDDMGLILNTALAGTWRYDDGPEADMTTSSSAGGRLIFTNLALPEDFVTPAMDGVGLTDVVLGGSWVTLSGAAALNANFPPVFSNAAVDAGDARYWVTDGGATDNRGMEMPLYALLEALRHVDVGPGKACAAPPDIEFIVADASAFSDGFAQSRGLSTIMAAGTMFNSQLVVELLRRLGEADPRLHFHYLPMPEALRDDNGIGTHWMLQPRLTIPARGRASEITLTSPDEIIGLVRGMFRSDAHASEDALVEEARHRVADKATHDAWSAIAAELADTTTPSPAQGQR